MKKFFDSQTFMFIFAVFAVVAVCGMDWGFRRYRATSVQLKPFQPIRNAIKIRASRGGPVATAMVNQGARARNRYSFMTDDVYETKVQRYSTPRPTPDPYVQGTCPCGDSCPGSSCPCGCQDTMNCPCPQDYSFICTPTKSKIAKLQPMVKKNPKWFLGRGEGSTYSFADMMAHCEGHTNMDKYHITEIGQLWEIHDAIHDGRPVDIWNPIAKKQVTFSDPACPT